MNIDIFEMERMQSTWENVVDYNLSESGVHPLNLKDLLTPAELDSLAEVEIGYTQTNGTPGLREAIARLYPGIGLEQILTTSGSSEANFLLIWSLIEPGGCRNLFHGLLFLTGTTGKNCRSNNSSCTNSCSCS